MRKALIIDDELDICLMVSKFLQTIQYSTSYALTVKEAFSKLKTGNYDVMFIDLNLTDGSGFEVMSYMTELNLASKIIVISAYDSEAVKAYEKGADLFIAKPFTLKTLSQSLMKLNLLPT